MKWETLKVNSDFEISAYYPHQIRKKCTKKIISESLSNVGYIQCNIGGVIYPKHRLIAFQWIENDNPEKKTQVDHINHNRVDNRVCNLRWVSPSENVCNQAGHCKRAWEYFDELPNAEEAIKVEQYNQHKFDNLYYVDNNFYSYNGLKYRKLTVLTNPRGMLFISTRDTENKSSTIQFSKFKRLYGIND